MKSNKDSQYLNTMSKNPAFWKGPLYINRKDPRLIVPKLHPSLGWTLNFASPGAYIFLAALTVVIVIVKLISK
jgi:uncharacterized membrane protein